ncbi:hypothetical protein [Sphingobium fluviale]|uniref:Uncharacterized protein n=1 Tax=Sphingobium fluviale TaxID=2506423 RepID=A0A4Q1KJ35_9SPHN|nr:hypothetical protein [Sphingobium fluviale]RXR29159.1 hypothetical protein EQG66_06595 [Sphingobium fluviale]
MSSNGYCQLINSQDGTGPDIIRARQRDSRQIKISTISEQWLFNLHGKLWRQTNATMLDGALDLEINPTRFLAYQDAPYAAELMQLPTLEVMHRAADRRIHLQHATLDTEDNILVGTLHLGGELFSQRSADWQRSLIGYLSHVQQCCVNVLAPPGSDAEIIGFEIRSVRQVECYWELRAEQAPLILRDMSIAVRSSDPEAEIHYLIGAAANASWLKIELTKKIHLVIYAKCMDRLRFEVRYIDGIQGELEAFHCNVASPMLQRLMDIRIGAAARVQRFWRDYAERLTPQFGAQQIIDFIASFNEIAPVAVRHELLTLLAANRALIANDEAGIVTNELCEALRRAGILERSRHRQRGRIYRMARRYRAVFQQMFGGDDIVT